MSKVSVKQQLENIRQVEANNAIEGIHIHPDDKALLVRAIKEGWSDEKLDAAMMTQFVEHGVIADDQPETHPAAAE